MAIFWPMWKWKLVGQETTNSSASPLPMPALFTAGSCSLRKRQLQFLPPCCPLHSSMTPRCPHHSDLNSLWISNKAIVDCIVAVVQLPRRFVAWVYSLISQNSLQEQKTHTLAAPTSACVAPTASDIFSPNPLSSGSLP